jgi:uncharacterized repeat protein (TIGR01451 family)
MKSRPLFALLLLAVPTPGLATPPPLPAPLLFVRLAGPPGTHLTVYQGGPFRRDLPTPGLLGLRPGYIYRVEITGLEGRPTVSLYPTLEVRGTLKVPPNLHAANFPATVALTEADLAAAQAGALVTKVIYLENPYRAEPVAQPPGGLLEFDLPPGEDLLERSRDFGRPVLVLRLGERQFSPEEMAGLAVPGTVLLPGDPYMPPAAGPPHLPFACWQWYDPRLGPLGPEEEYLFDGGDHALKAGFDGQGGIGGVDPQDAVAEYVDSCGRRCLVCSNRVCLFAPRFAALRSVLPLGGYDVVLRVGNAKALANQLQVDVRWPPFQARQAEQPVGFEGRLRPSGTENVQRLIRLDLREVLEAQQLNIGPLAVVAVQGLARLTEVERTLLLRQIEFAQEYNGVQGLKENDSLAGPVILGHIQNGPEVIIGRAETRDLTVCCDECPCPPDKPLVLVKCADKHAAQPGEVVTFTLRYSNHGGRPISGVAVVDSLTTRLEYIPGSAQSDRDAVFTVQENEAGSLLLRWEVSGVLQPGSSGILKFQARVR